MRRRADRVVSRVRAFEGFGIDVRWDAGAFHGVAVCARDEQGAGVEGAPRRWAVTQESGDAAMPAGTRASTVTGRFGCAGSNVQPLQCRAGARPVLWLPDGSPVR